MRTIEAHFKILVVSKAVCYSSLY